MTNRCIDDAILIAMGIKPEGATVTAFIATEDGSEYDVWKVSADDACYVLKAAKEQELEIYSTFLKNLEYGVPRLYNTARVDDTDYFLMEYIPGVDLCKCNRVDLKKLLDALIFIQERFWNNTELQNFGYCYEKSFQSCINRGKYIFDSEIEEEYDRFLKLYAALPRTLCHDDLLPFNVLISKERAAIIDWEVAGILPYPNSLVRLIAHGTEDGSDLFYMTDKDKTFAIDYYYDNFIINKGIERHEYYKAINFFLLYEYCEWVMIGNKYEQVDSDRFTRYLAKARNQAKLLKEIY